MLQIVLAGNPSTSVLDASVIALLVADNTIHEVSYVDFLVAIHRKIPSKVLDKKRVA